MTSHVRFAFDAVHDGDGAGVPDNFDGPTEEGLLEYMMQTKAGDWGAGAAGEGMIIDDVSRINLPLLNPSGLVHHHGQPGGPHEEYSFDEHNKGSVDTRERSTDDELLPDELFQAIQKRVTDPGSVSDPNATHSTGEVSFLESCKVSIERRHTVSSSNDEAIMTMHDRDASSMGDGMGCVENSEYGGEEEAGGMLQKLKRTISAPCGMVQQSSGAAPPKRPKKPRPMSTILANRRSAARSRARRIQYVADLESSVQLLRDRVYELTEELKNEKLNNHMAVVENAALRCQIEAKNTLIN